MDATDSIAPQTEQATLSYDDTVAYEEQLPTEAERAAEAARSASLANRIGNSRVYLLSESSTAATRITKRKHETEGGDTTMEDVDELDGSGTDPTYRNNAIFFSGEPIAHLPTARLFAYATHFDVHPMGLEWVDDQTCVFVFSSRKDARDAFAKLTKPAVTMSANAETAEDVVPMSIDNPADTDYTLAKAFPISLWPPEERITQTLGKGHGLKGPICMRWARVDDVKKKGAKQASRFYRKHGSKAGKELFNGRDLPPVQPPKRKQTEWLEEEERRKELDKELDDFLAEDEENEGDEYSDSRHKKRPRHSSRTRTPMSHEGPRSPPSKMRSDYIADDGRTLLERTSLLRHHPYASDPLDDTPDLASRLMVALPKGRRRREDLDRLSPGNRIGIKDSEKLHWGRSNDTDSRTWRRGKREREIRRGGANKIGDRPKITQQELDDELDAFFNGKDRSN